MRPLAAFLAALCCAAAASADDGVIKIGVTGPYSGDFASYAIPSKNAAQLAVDEINREGGVLGKRLLLVAEDDVCEANTAANVAHKFAAEGVRFVVGHFCSGATKAALPVYADAGAIAISPATTNEDITLGGGNPHFFRTISHDGAQAQKQVEFAKDKLGVKRAAVIHDKSDYGKGLAELIIPRLREAGIEIVLEEGITPGAPDYAALVAKFKEAGASGKEAAIFFAGRHPEASKIVVAARKKRNRAHFISGDSVKGPAFIETAGRYALDFYATSPADTSALPAAVAFAADYREAFEEDPNIFSYTAYAAVQAFAAAIKAAGRDDDAAAAQAALRRAKVQTPLGEISFDENGDIVGAGFQMFQARAVFAPVE